MSEITQTQDDHPSSDGCCWPMPVRRAPMVADYDERTTIRAWEALLTDADEEWRHRSPVRNLIQQSWTRCATGGIDAQRGEAPIESGRAELEHRTFANRELLEASRHTFASIGSLLEGTEAMLVLADSDGVLIDVIGDRSTIHKGMNIHLGVGGKWTEDVIGTNGIGTALQTGLPVYVHAAEHFCAGIRGWTCAGAPIRDSIDGSVVGVVDLSGPPGIFRPHNIALVAAAAREIEKAIADRQCQNRLRLLEAFITAAPDYRRRDGLVIVDHMGRPIYCNNLPEPLASDLQSARRAGVPPRRLPIAFPGGRKGLEIVGTLPEGLRDCHVSELRAGDDLRGAAMVLPARGPAADSRSVVVSRARTAEISAAASLIVGESEAIRAAIDDACRVASAADVTSCLIEGETGVGKELFARLVHAGSRKGAASPFLALNCGAITRELFGAELFGHGAGAFTGATREGKPGVFELADGGVLSLDEIGEMPLEMQPFLLRVLEERVVCRIGESRPRPVDVRLVASTNRSLKAEVEAGRFRRDLYYRISTVDIRVPPLRDRAGDIPLLIAHFNARFAARVGRDPLDFSADALDRLTAHAWPGNVRELRNLVERLHVLTPDRLVRLADLPIEIRDPERVAATPEAPPAETSTPSLRPQRDGDRDRRLILEALAAESGNLSRVALRLGISRPTLYRKLKDYGIRRDFV